MQMGNQEQSFHGGNMPNQDRYGYKLKEVCLITTVMLLQIG